ncbi:DUF6233 domain-containing protein [Streptomyces sp. NPDC017890]|uniref:DUF6233 domain-containing protein n=1 Tax=Streptomyces sp. NPDC017890 TaxID=3365015 RepID=UPI00378A2C75
MTAATPVPPIPVAPAGLTRRAKRFVEVEGVRVPREDIERHRDAWLRHGIPAAQIDRVAAIQDRWGGLALPPAPFHESGPRILDSVEPGVGARRPPLQVHAGDCYMAGSRHRRPVDRDEA